MRSLLPSARLLLAATLPITAAAQQGTDPDEERTTVGGYGEVHCQNASGPATPGAASAGVLRFYTA